MIKSERKKVVTEIRERKQSQKQKKVKGYKSMTHNYYLKEKKIASVFYVIEPWVGIEDTEYASIQPHSFSELSTVILQNPVQYWTHQSIQSNRYQADMEKGLSKGKFYNATRPLSRIL